MQDTITKFDKLIIQKLDHVLCGGDLSELTEVSEQYPLVGPRLS